MRFLPSAVLLLVLVLVLPLWPWSRGWGYAPAGMLAVGLVSVVLFTYAVVPQ